MPELPEVETIARALGTLIRGRTINETWIGDDRLVRPGHASEVMTRLAPGRISAIARRGKYLMFSIEHGPTMVWHLRMTGSFHMHDGVGEPAAPASDPRWCADLGHVRAVMTLDDGRAVRYRDVRRFGTLEVYARSELAHSALDVRLGPEPLDGDWTSDDLARACGSRRTSIKAVLLDQHVVAGIGNIYADEALFRARIAPHWRASGLRSAEIIRLHEAVLDRLSEGIRREGATLRDYAQPDGGAGGMQETFQVYGRLARPCRTCASPIAGARVAGRSTFWCPSCQRRARSNAG